MFEKLNKFTEDKFNLAALSIFIIGLFLRLYKLNGFVTFLGDQGRDAIIIKRILTFEHWPAIGPPTSVGQVYLGPFYYYFISPWLALFNFEPLGLAFGVALFSSLFILINYYLVKDLFNRQVALISTIFVAFSSILIEFSRFSWNPNLLPMFSFLTVYFFIKAFKNLDWKMFALAGAFLSFSTQLHYLTLFLFLPLLIFFIFQLFEKKKDLEQILLGGASAFFSFLLFSLPLVIFDLRHDFLNINNLLHLLNAPKSVGMNKLINILDSYIAFNQHSFNASSNVLFSSIILVLFIASLVFVVRRRNNLRSLLIFFVITFLSIGYYLDAKYPHYFGLLYPLYYVLVAYFISSMINSRIGKFVVVLFMTSFIFLNYQSYYFLNAKENNQIDIARKIAKIIYNNVDNKDYRLTALPQQYGDYTYRYFLEIWGKKPIEKGSLAKVPTLFVVCETECKPIGDPEWDVAYFAPRKITDSWQINNVKIFKLTR